MTLRVRVLLGIMVMAGAACNEIAEHSFTTYAEAQRRGPGESGSELRPR